MKRARVALVAVVALGGCPKHDQAHTEPTTKHDALGSAGGLNGPRDAAEPELPPLAEAVMPRSALGLPLQPINPLLANYVAFGEVLFGDTLLSSDGKTSCATCHDPDHGFAGTGRQVTASGQPNLRAAQALVNLSYAIAFGWDGRSTSLVEFMPAHFKGQLGNAMEEVVVRLRGVPLYRAHLARLTDQFTPKPGEPALATPPRVAPDQLALDALAMYAMFLYNGNSPWDLAEQAGTVTPELRAGHALFVDKAQCAGCHPPPLYTDNRFHRLGLIASHDEGRGRVDPAQTGAFATPTLRGAAARSTFFHDASARSLDAAIDWHLAGGIGQGADPSIIDPALHEVALTPVERAQLGAFVRALTPVGEAH